ncbi:Imm42 family immunity protein [Commensalibacter nepenthis]|uniref:Imm42 family immunity protein n=1 Tax=Commensalibacter nepenthis TaxID=3043872 RepID=A0ABT6QBS6_9PROT|nr:Imm42 family immunity protein [Commensalibacter sp. TBRC 10068]MDI2113733.1 Imm42 family immunity protein [Commensalibacter sp. TBRC 10068]
MIFGDKKNFAIRFELDPEDNYGKFMLGKFCFYIKNQKFGDWNECSILLDVMNCLGRSLRNNKKRYCPNLFDLNDKKIFDLIFYSVYDNNREIYRYLPENFHADQWSCKTMS